ncbi:MAG: DUF6787 family protein [Thermoflexibacteraceae bacterium]|jgi:hypothetical protein
MANPPNWISKLQARWGVSSIWQVLVILLVFALTGFSILYLKRLLLNLLDMTPETAWYYRWSVTIFIILPLYQVVLLFYGTLLGQFRFFWEFEKRMFSRMAFWKKSKQEDN